MNTYLESITIRFPAAHSAFTEELAAFFNGLGHLNGQVLELTSSQCNFFPRVRLDTRSASPDVLTDFTLSDGKIISVKVENNTGMQRKSLFAYELLELKVVKERFRKAGIQVTGLDHAGINLPWFSQGLHPVIQSLREALAASCLYHQFPSGEPWDFIIPGDVEEIRQVKPVEYNTTRRPKFELVSFETDSKPLVQFDLGVDAGYEVFQPLFPEALNDPQFHNIWIYLENPLPLDVCLVINQFGSADWSPFFKDSRL